MSTVTAGIQILPNGKDDHTDGILTEIVRVIQESGLTYEVGAMETVVEGELDTVFAVIKKVNDKSIDLGANEVHSHIKMHYRPSGISINEKKL
ncbi:thiamine-binding protein [Alkalicoccobacillus porphyridii]|uniref:Thiamine-binding protein n=1 Tax=Alkalicoccobacillus porphyridii TaxID=2597270 RepID=A0A554A0G6_9BACI|nr:thiamine-binding protein [Alkalicoccobacillus porphyridii]TSB47192.1 thiamine-binding protein [Alkalicoccobacillus porphyridii]